MLCFSRKTTEGFFIGSMYVQINQIEAGKVMVGIDAPREVEILRDELVLCGQKLTQRRKGAKDPDSNP